MTKKEIRETKKMLIDVLEKEERWHNCEYNSIDYVGEHDGFQVWDPGNTDKILWVHPAFVLYDPKTKKYEWVIWKEADKLMSVLMKKYPDFFSEEAAKKRNWKINLNNLRIFERADRAFYGDEYADKKYDPLYEEVYRYKAEAEKEEAEED